MAMSKKNKISKPKTLKTTSATSKNSSVIKGHQKDLAKIAGRVAYRNAIKPGPKAPLPFERNVIARRAERKTLKSFK